jgi:hypothetical protein
LRSNRSRKNPAAIPNIPALIAYEETIKPNCAGEIEKTRMYCGPSGIMMMKSTMVVK